MIRQRAGMALIGGALIAVSTWVAPTVASAEPIRAQACDPPQDIYVQGTEGHWTECHDGDRTSVDGWEKDTREDGMCARIVIDSSNGQNG